MLAEHIERPSIDWPDWKRRFSEEPRVIVASQTAEPAMLSEPLRPHSGRGRKPVSGCPDDEHYWISKGLNQVQCKNCTRTILRAILPRAAVIHKQKTGRPMMNLMPDKEQPKCEKSATGTHKWLSKGPGRVRCSLCRMTAKRKA